MIAAGTTYYWTSAFTGFRVTGSLDNAGLLWATATAAASPVELADGGSLSNSGTIVAEVEAGAATTVNAEWAMAAGEIANSGDLFALAAAGNAIGIRVWQPGYTIENSGTIAVQAFDDPASPNDAWGTLTSGKAIGIFVGGGDVPIVNHAPGQILVEGDHAFGMWLRGSGAGASYAFDLDNQGLIKAASTLEGSPSCGLYLVETAGQQMRVLNSGTIDADVAIFAPSEGPETLFSDITYGSESITNTASGIVRGSIELRNGDDLLVNYGHVSGKVDMGPGDDTVDTSGGSLEGLVYLGLGDDLFLGSAAADRATGDGGNDRLEGNSGDDLLLGGVGDDVLIGGSGNDGLYGEFGNDRLVIEGGDQALGGAGDDRLELTDYSFELADGGDGIDMLVLPAGTRLIDLAKVAGSGRVTDVEGLVLGGDKELVVRSSDIGSITGGSSLRIDALATDKVDLVGAWLERAEQVIGGVTYRVFAGGRREPARRC